MLSRIFPAVLSASVALTCCLISPSFSQTKPKMQVPAEERAHAKAIVNQLLKEGKIIRSNSVRRGMMGYALSVFQGTKIEKFPIVVLGNLERVQGGGDIVLIKVLGGPVVERQSGIIAGMSGSPVFINGKMLGAIALGWGFPKEPIGGVTPITEMIETSLPDPGRAKPTPQKSVPQDNPQKATAAVYSPSTPLVLGGKRITRMEISRDPNRLALHGPEHGATMTMRPVNTLLQLSGFSQSSLPRLREMFEPYQITPMIGPASRKTGVSPPVAPGSAMGVQLVSGDMDQTAVGTVTFRFGNRILAFGHPMFGQGASSLPLTSAYVHEIFPSYQRSFKLASPINPVGAIQQDTQYAVGGTLHTKADTIPMSVTVRDASRNIARTFNVQVMKDPVLTPQLIVMVASEAVESKLGLTSDKMVRVRMRVDIENAPSIVRQNLLYANDVVSKAALTDLAQSLQLSQLNEFARGSIKRVDLDVSLEEGRSLAVIKAMTANKNKVKAGETVQITVVMERLDAPNKPITRTFDFKVPDDAPDGVLRLAAAASVNFWPLQMRVGGAPPDPTNLPELVAAWNKVGSFNELMVQASTPSQYLQVGDQKVSNPAPAWAQLVKGARATSVGAYNEVDVRRATVPFVLEGAQFLNIPVESRNNSGESTASTEDEKATTPATPATTEGTDQVPGLPGVGEDNNADDDDYTEDDQAVGPGAKSSNALLTFDTPRQWSWKALDEAAWKALRKTSLEGASRLQTRKEPPGRDAGGERPISGTGANPTPTPTPTPTPSPTPTPTPTPTPAPTGGRSVGRPTLSWTQSGTTDFLKGKVENAFVTNTGVIRAAPPVRQIATTAEPFVWSIAGDSEGNVYLGTGLSAGNRARILKVDASGKQSTFWEGEGVAVTALTTDKSGNVYAGIAPSGKVLRIEESGTPKVIAELEEFVWSLEWSKSERGNQYYLIAATGGNKGSLHFLTRVSPQGMLLGSQSFEDAKSGYKTIVEVNQKHIRSVASRGDEIFFGTGAEGVLYRYNTASKKLEALWQAGDAKTAATAEVLAVAADKDAVYFGTSTSGTIYRWTERDGVQPLYASPQKIVYSLKLAPDGVLYAATGDAGVVYRIEPGNATSETKVARLLEPDQRQSLALALSPAGDSLLIGTGNNGAAYRVALGEANGGTYLSPIFDAKSQVRWGSLRTISRGAAIETRSGNTAEPDASWSDWQTLSTNDLGENSVASPPGRYLQYRARLSGGASTPDAAALSRLEIAYRATNSTPAVALTAPKGGEYWMGKKKITWVGKDPDNDALQYRAFISSDNGATWQALGEAASKDASFELDTSKYPDGNYRLRVVASDVIANPEDPREDQVTSLPIVLDNTAPVLEAVLSQNAGGWKLQGVGTDSTSQISGVEWRFAAKGKPVTATTETKAVVPGITAPAPSEDAKKDESESKTSASTDAAKKAAAKDSEWLAAAPADGIFDSRREAFVATIAPSLLPGPVDAATIGTEYRIEVRLYDAAGNRATVNLELPQ